MAIKIDIDNNRKIQISTETYDHHDDNQRPVNAWDSVGLNLHKHVNGTTGGKNEQIKPIV